MAYYTDKVPGRTIALGGQEYLFFGGTSYLGVQSDLRFQKLLLRNIRSYGMHHGASRISNLQMSIYNTTEQYLASWAGSPAALTVSSGFLAGQLLSTYFNNEGYRIFRAPNAHAALSIPENRQYGSYEHLAEAINSHISGKNPAIPVLFMDSFDFSPDSYPDYGILRSLPLKQLLLVADDSHGLGILGQEGAGSYRELAKLPLNELLVCGSVGKALGLQGGLVLGTSARIGSLMGTPFFAGASPPSPAHMATLSASASLFRDLRNSLFSKVILFENECHCLDKFIHMKGYPVYGYKDSELTSFLFASGILVTDFQYPSGQAGVLPGRIVLSAHHTEQDIRLLTRLLDSYYDY